MWPYCVNKWNNFFRLNNFVIVKRFKIFLIDLCDSYVKNSMLNAICRHSSVPCEIIDIANYQTSHSERNCLSADVAVNLQIDNEISLCHRIAFKIICDCWIYCVFRSPLNRLNILFSLATNSKIYMLICNPCYV